MVDQTPDLYVGRVGHDVSEGFCSCGGYHEAKDSIEVGTKTVLTADGVKILSRHADPTAHPVDEI